MEFKEAKAIMMERFRMSDLFSPEEIEFIDHHIIEDKKNGRAILKLWVINEMENKGIHEKFYEVCKNHHYFPNWLKDVRDKKDPLGVYYFD